MIRIRQGGSLASWQEGSCQLARGPQPARKTCQLRSCQLEGVLANWQEGSCQLAREPFSNWQEGFCQLGSYELARGLLPTGKSLLLPTGKSALANWQELTRALLPTGKRALANWQEGSYQLARGLLPTGKRPPRGLLPVGKGALANWQEGFYQLARGLLPTGKRALANRQEGLRPGAHCSGVVCGVWPVGASQGLLCCFG